MVRNRHPFVAGRMRDGAARDTIQCRPSVLLFEVDLPLGSLRLPVVERIQGMAVRTSIPLPSAGFGDRRVSVCLAGVCGEMVQASGTM